MQMKKWEYNIRVNRLGYCELPECNGVTGKMEEAVQGPTTRLRNN